jgi:hypothetical protein
MRSLVWTLVFLAIPAISTAEGGPFGLGIALGEPTGICGKYILTPRNAIAGAVAWSLDSDTDLHLQGDYLYHWYDEISVTKGRLPIVAGVGGRIRFRDDGDDDFGIRFPVGLTYLFDDAPFDAFVEIDPILELAPDTDFDLEAAIGGRFYF